MIKQEIKIESIVNMDLEYDEEKNLLVIDEGDIIRVSILLKEAKYYPQTYRITMVPYRDYSVTELMADFNVLLLSVLLNT